MSIFDPRKRKQSVVNPRGPVVQDTRRIFGNATVISKLEIDKRRSLSVNPGEKSRRDGGGTSRAATLRSYEAVFEIARSFLKSDIEQRPSKQHETSYACARHGIPRISIAANRRATSNKAVRGKRKCIYSYSQKYPANYAIRCILLSN